MHAVDFALQYVKLLLYFDGVTLSAIFRIFSNILA